jgi:Arc/MetJ-type ribon-helix-helix transcriptional regulator
MDLNISAENAQFLQDQVSAGSFPTADAAVDAALEMLKQQAELRTYQRDLDGLRDQVRTAIEEIDRGASAELDKDFFLDLELEFDRRGIPE